MNVAHNYCISNQVNLIYMWMLAYIGIYDFFGIVYKEGMRLLLNYKWNSTTEEHWEISSFSSRSNPHDHKVRQWHLKIVLYRLWYKQDMHIQVLKVVQWGYRFPNVLAVNPFF